MFLVVKAADKQSQLGLWPRQWTAEGDVGSNGQKNRLGL